MSGFGLRVWWGSSLLTNGSSASVRSGIKFAARRVIGLRQRRALRARTWRGGGRLGQFFFWVTIFGYRLRTLRRFILELPIRGQRSRSNANTTRRLRFNDVNQYLFRFRVRRIHAGSTFGESAKKKKIQSKLKPKKSQSAESSKRKGPVRRTRDTKKSVWG